MAKRKALAFKESAENRRDLARLIYDRWENILKACKSFGWDPGPKPKRPKDESKKKRHE